jgi:putative tryptophan/tyrosine transport system substrate-binding protein
MQTNPIKVIFSLALGVLLFAISLPTEAQQPATKIPVIGVLRSDSPSVHASEHETFQQGLRQLGYVVDQNILIEYRYSEGKADRLPKLAAD